MSALSPTMTSALRALQAAVDTPRTPGASLSGWRWSVRQQMPAVRDALLQERGGVDDPDPATDGWLAARGGTAFGERNVLLGRLSEMGVLALESPDPDAVRADVTRLVADVTHHVQRLHELAHDAVEVELGGSE